MSGFTTPMILKSPDGFTRRLVECNQNPIHEDLLDYTMEILDGRGDVEHEIKSTCDRDTIAMFYRYHFAMIGDYDALGDRPLILDILHDPMEFKFTVTAKGGDYNFRLPFRDVSYDALEQYANELYNLDIWGQPIYLSGAIGTTHHAITLREFRKHWEGHDNASAWDRTLSRAVRTIEEYQRRLNHFIKTGEKELTW